MAHEAFYETAAQVIPVLFVILVLETRAFQAVTTSSSRRASRAFDWFFTVISVGYFPLVEFIAIDALYSGNDGDARRRFVHYALFFMLAMVGYVALRISLEPMKAGKTNRRGTGRASTDETPEREDPS